MESRLHNGDAAFTSMTLVFRNGDLTFDKSCLTTTDHHQANMWCPGKEASSNIWFGSETY